MSEPFLGQLALFPWGLVPKYWAPCQGQTMSIAQNQALFALLGTTFGGNGTTTFNLPDLRGRTPIMVSSDFPLGSQAGEEMHRLTIAEVPPHTHQLQAANVGADATKPNGNLPGNTTGSLTIYQQNPDGSTLAPGTMSPYGGSQPHENRTPFLAMNWCIALSGIFPSRN
jgi:microcystin-dependent protein